MNAAPGIGLPPGAEYRKSRVVRILNVEEDGRMRRVVRQVAFSLEDARKTGADYYDRKLGWIHGGVKMEREHPLVAASVLAAAAEFEDEEEEEEAGN